MLFVALVMGVCISGCQPKLPTLSVQGTWIMDGDWTYGGFPAAISLNFYSDKTGKLTVTYKDGSGDVNENFEYDYVEADRELVIVGSSLDGKYKVTLTATKLKLAADEYNDSFGDDEFLFSRR